MFKNMNISLLAIQLSHGLFKNSKVELIEVLLMEFGSISYNLGGKNSIWT